MMNVIRYEYKRISDNDTPRHIYDRAALNATGHFIG